MDGEGADARRPGGRRVAALRAGPRRRAAEEDQRGQRRQGARRGRAGLQPGRTVPGLPLRCGPPAPAAALRGGPAHRQGPPAHPHHRPPRAAALQPRRQDPVGALHRRRRRRAGALDARLEADRRGAGGDQGAAPFARARRRQRAPAAALPRRPLRLRIRLAPRRRRLCPDRGARLGRGQLVVRAALHLGREGRRGAAAAQAGPAESASPPSAPTASASPSSKA